MFVSHYLWKLGLPNWILIPLETTVSFIEMLVIMAPFIALGYFWNRRIALRQARAFIQDKKYTLIDLQLSGSLGLSIDGFCFDVRFRDQDAIEHSRCLCVPMRRIPYFLATEDS